MDLHKPLFLFIFVVFLCLVFAAGSTHDKESLLAFRSKISNDPLGVFNSWNDSTHYCNWMGVTCGRRHHSRVTVLNLESQQLQGTLSPHTGNLSFLRELRLTNNTFSLEIPQELRDLSRLEILSLANNSFTGKIPSNLSRCSNLRDINLRGNELGGVLPLELGSLPKLQYLNLGSNNFVGNIPPSLGNLSSLEFFSISHNHLHGSIPSTFGRLRNLRTLIIQNNTLSGQFPESVFNLSMLTRLGFAGNRLNGSLPKDIGFTLPKLEALSLHTNQFSGTIPLSVSNLTFLDYFDIARNRFSGKVPYLGSLRHLRFLVLSGNSLGGNGENDDLNFMSSLVNCTKLEILGLNDNNFGGMMPELLSNFSTSMKQLVFGSNQIRGRIPTEIGNLVNLEILGMEENLLTSTIPSSIGKLQNLYGLYLSRNNLFGDISSSIGNLTSLGELDLGQNSLQGSIPPNIGLCKNLLRLYFSQNNLSGSIPQELFDVSSCIELDLSKNMLTGLLPPEVGNLVNLGYLDVSENNLFGEISETLHSCTSLETLYLEGNSFHGEIPSSLESLRGLQYLDLSRNNLSGHDPDYFENFDLLYFNLSWNDFEGRLPNQRVFSNLTAISIEGNIKLCGGIPELHLPACPSDKSKPSNMKLIVSLVGALIGVILVSFSIFVYMSRKTRRAPIKSSSSIAVSIPIVSYDDLLKATNGFSSSNLVGVGGFGYVFKGFLGPERSVVAIKVLILTVKGATKSFMAECEVLRSIRHKNLVKIITACSSVDFKGNDFKALVYEFMVNGSLEDWLHPSITNQPDEQKYLSFVQRFIILVDVANALDYMHNECQTPIVHCDLKPSNILIDKDMFARVGDFGLARLCPEASRQFSSTQNSSLGIKGSIGYAAPEYGMGSEVSTYGDVYSFGILLLEIFTSKRPTDSMFNDGLDLNSYAKMALPERVMFIADPLQFQSNDQFRSDKFWNCFRSVIQIGVACSVESPRDRMNIKSVVEEFVHIKDSFLRTGYISSFDPVDIEG